MQQAFDDEAAGLTIRRIRIRITPRRPAEPVIDMVDELCAMAAATLIPLTLAALWVVLP